MLKSSRGASQLGHPYLSLLLVVLLGIGISMSSPSAAADATDDTGDSSPPGSLVNATPTTNTYQSSDGTFVTDIYADSVNYIDDSGTIQPIDATLTPVPGPDPDVRNSANRFEVQLPPNLSGPVEVTGPQGRITLQLLGADSDRLVDGDTATYPEAFPGVTVAFSAAGDQVSETLTLGDSSAPATYVYSLVPGEGLTPQQNTSGGIDLVDQAGSVAFSLPAPVVEDSATYGRAFPYSARQTLTHDLSGWRLTQELDNDWLRDASRVWPVIMDPDVTLGPNPDCWYQSGTSGTTQACLGTGLNVGYNSNGLRRAALRFSIPNLIGATVTSARLFLTLTATNNNKLINLEIDPLTNPWASPGVNWTTRDGTVAWASAGGDFASSPSVTVNNVGGTLTGPVAIGTGSPPAIDITSIAQYWAAGAPNDGILLRQQSDSAATSGNILTFGSSESTTHPALEITYTPPCATASVSYEYTDAGRYADVFFDWANCPAAGTPNYAIDLGEGSGFQTFDVAPGIGWLYSNEGTVDWSYREPANGVVVAGGSFDVRFDQASVAQNPPTAQNTTSISDPNYNTIFAEALWTPVANPTDLDDWGFHGRSDVPCLTPSGTGPFCNQELRDDNLIWAQGVHVLLYWSGSGENDGWHPFYDHDEMGIPHFYKPSSMSGFCPANGNMTAGCSNVHVNKVSAGYPVDCSTVTDTYHKFINVRAVVQAVLWYKTAAHPNQLYPAMTPKAWGATSPATFCGAD